MRVIAGRLGGQTFAAPTGHRTHPMSEKVRGALFNALGDIAGLTMLDCFAGSGALSFEAISRGAASATAIDISKKNQQQIEESSEQLGITSLKIVRANVSSWSDNNRDLQFDLVLCDPPYDDIKASLLEKLTIHVKPGGVIVYSLPPDTVIKLSAVPLTLIAEKGYGDATLHFYRRNK